MTVDAGALDTVLDLSSVFADVDVLTDGDALSLTVTGNDNPSLLATDLENNLLTITYIQGQSGSARITVRATDQDAAWTEDEFVVVVTS